MNTDQFAEQIKQKYPQYKDMDNLELSKKIIDKYPQYKSAVVMPATLEVPKEVGIFKGIAKDFGKRNEAMVKAQQSNQGIGSKILQTYGQGAGFLGDVVNRGVKAIGNIIPEAIKKPFVAGFKETGKDIASSELGQKGIEAMSNGLEYYNQFKQDNPEIAANLESGVNIAMVVPILKGLKEAGIAGNSAFNIARDAVKAGSGTIGNVATKVGQSVTGAKGAISDVITPLEKGVESTLNPTVLIPKEKLANISIDNIKALTEGKSVKLDRYVKQAKKAVSDYSQKTPLTLAGDKASEAINIIQNKINKQSLLKKDALGKVGEKTVANINEVRDLFNKELQDKIGVTLNITEEGAKVVDALGRKSKVAFDPADNKLIADAGEALKNLGDKPTVREIDDTVDALQDLLYKRQGLTAIPVNSQVQSLLKNITGKLNRSVKKIAGEQYTKANAKMAYMIDTFESLNKALGKEGERGASLMKQLFSPAGEKPRRLFAESKKLTGIDLTEEATLAKFVMENVGDARQASLLEEVIRGRTMSPAGLIEKAFEKTIGKLQDPIGKAKRVINK